MRVSLTERHTNYITRCMASLAVTLFLAVLAVNLWPNAPAGQDKDIILDPPTDDLVVLQEIMPTRQSAPRSPPPPRPVPPIIVPDDLILSEVEIDYERPSPQEAGDGDGADGERDGVPEFVARADQGPRSLRLVEPEYPSAAQRAGIKARIIVEVKVDAQGRVTESRILERYLLGPGGRADHAVAQLGYGLEEAAVAAADRWRFRPAMHRGMPVGTIATLTFTFGV